MYTCRSNIKDTCILIKNENKYIWWSFIIHFKFKQPGECWILQMRFARKDTSNITKEETISKHHTPFEHIRLTCGTKKELYLEYSPIQYLHLFGQYSLAHSTYGALQLASGICQHDGSLSRQSGNRRVHSISWTSCPSK